MKELITKWAEYKTTERYKTVVQNKKAAGMGMGLMSSVFGQEDDIFTDFMNWLVDPELGEDRHE